MQVLSLAPKSSTQVGDPWMPIFSSIFGQWTLLYSPRDPSGFTRYLGTMNSDRPLTPFGAPSVRARTRWTMFSVRSCSPLEMKTLVPSIR